MDGESSLNLKVAGGAVSLFLLISQYLPCHYKILR